LNSIDSFLVDRLGEIGSPLLFGKVDSVLNKIEEVSGVSKKLGSKINWMANVMSVVENGFGCIIDCLEKDEILLTKLARDVAIHEEI
jgi:hypothetical protein